MIKLNKETLTGELWAITCYFNPAEYSNKRENFTLFRDNLKKQGVKLLTVELAFNDDDFELKKSESDKLIQVRTKSILWQKERLLNIALDKLPKSCDKVAWLDADILFDNHDWPNKAAALLENYKVIQLFSHFIRLDKGANLNELNVLKSERELPSGYVYAKKCGSLEDGSTGFAWAARRDFLDKVKFYDRNIIGGGDRIFLCGLFPHDFGLFHLPNTYSQDHLNDITSWIRRCNAECGDSVFYVDGVLFHIWHGSSKNRQYLTRHLLLKKYCFDPVKDIQKNTFGVWEWSSDKHKLHEGLQKYFFKRKEECYNICDNNFRTLSDYKKLCYLDTWIGLVGRTIRKVHPSLYIYLKKKYDLMTKK